MLCFITDSSLNPGGLRERAEKIMAAGAGYLMLREKNLPEKELAQLAIMAGQIAARQGGRLIVNSSPAAALAAGAWGLHLPYSALAQFGFDLFGLKKNSLLKVGVSIHSLAEAETAARAGADSLLAGNIFESTCKAGQPGRGLGFLRALTKHINLPVWAVGGIKPGNIGQVFSAGAEVACARSPLMFSGNPGALAEKYLAAASLGNKALAASFADQ